MKTLKQIAAIALTCILCLPSFSACSNSPKPLDVPITDIYDNSFAFTVTTDWGRDAICFDLFDSSGLRIAVIDSTNYYEADNVSNYSVCNIAQDSAILSHGSYIVSSLCSLLPNADVICINVADENGNISNDALSKGILYASDLGCDIINISLGTQKNYKNVEDAVENAFENGCIVVAASGNERQLDIDFPARYPNVISVMSRSIDNIDDITNNISNSKKSISAPGSIVFNDCFIFSGSSISTVYVVAEVAYIISNQSNATYEQIYRMLTESCVFATDYSYGMINHRLIKNFISKGKK